MHEPIAVRSELLPREKHYRPSRHVLNWKPVLVIAFLWAVSSIVLPIYGLSLNPWLWAGCIILWTVYIQRQMVRCVAKSQEGIAWLNAGELDKAAEVFENLCIKGCPPRIHAVVVFNRGIAFMRTGDFDRAISLFTAVQASGSFENRRSGLRPFLSQLFTAFAKAYALKGDLDSAEKWQGLAHDFTLPAREGMLLQMDITIAIRRARYAAAAKDAGAGWFSAEGCLTPADMKATRLLRAFALSQLPNAADTGEREEEFITLCAGAKPFRQGEFNYLALRWPEFRSFLKSHGFSGPVLQEPTVSVTPNSVQPISVRK